VKASDHYWDSSGKRYVLLEIEDNGPGMADQTDPLGIMKDAVAQVAQ
jgi:hypothetical protein